LGAAVLAGAPCQFSGRRLRQHDDGRRREERIKAAYRGNYDRLSQIKKRYDPTNLFHINHNIPPAA
jgi:FAD/FMN-containing dehydrogenase